MANIIYNAIILSDKNDFDTAMEVFQTNEFNDYFNSASILGNDYVVRFDVRSTMDWDIVRQLSSSLSNCITILTYYEVDGGLIETQYYEGKRLSRKELCESDIEYWNGLIKCFGNINYHLSVGNSKEIVVKSNYQYPYYVDISIREFNSTGDGFVYTDKCVKYMFNIYHNIWDYINMIRTTLLAVVNA